MLPASPNLSNYCTSMSLMDISNSPIITQRRSVRILDKKYASNKRSDGFDDQFVHVIPRKRLKPSQLDFNDFNTRIPDEVKKSIFALLPFDDLMSATLVCKQWNTTISNDDDFIDKIIVSTGTKVNLPPQPFTRRYKHFEIKTLPTSKVFKEKFAPIRLEISSIKIFVNTEFSKVRAFLDEFPNLTSLELHHDFDASDCFKIEQDKKALSLLKLTSFSIFVATSMNFAAHALTVISMENQLTSFEFSLGHGPSCERLTMFNLKTLLNHQQTLKSLKLNIKAGRMFIPLKKIAFVPCFKLEQLTLVIPVTPLIDEQSADMNNFLLKLLCASTNHCKVLHIDITAACLEVFVERLVELTQLKKLKFVYNHERDSEQYTPFNPLLASKLMKSRLTKLEVAGSVLGQDGIAESFLTFESNALRSLLLQQRNSLVELTLAGNVTCKNPVWKFIGTQMKELKVLRSHQLTKTALEKFSGSNIETLVIVKRTQEAEELIADVDFWKGFFAKNTNVTTVKFDESCLNDE